MSHTPFAVVNALSATQHPNPLHPSTPPQYTHSRVTADTTLLEMSWWGSNQADRAQPSTSILPTPVSTRANANSAKDNLESTQDGGDSDSHVDRGMSEEVGEVDGHQFFNVQRCVHSRAGHGSVARHVARKQDLACCTVNPARTEHVRHLARHAPDNVPCSTPIHFRLLVLCSNSKTVVYQC
jgi:hypothetical protein